MSIKLAFKNTKSGLRSHEASFLTLSFGICAFYLSSSICEQKKILAVSRTVSMTMEALQHLAPYISAFIAVIFGFLTLYADLIFIRYNKKRLGIYLLLGMNREKVFRTLIFETFFVTAAALLAGLATGVFLSQLMSLFAIKLLGTQTANFTFLFSLSAALKCIVYYGITFAIVILCNAVTILRLKLVDLLYEKARANRRSIKTKTVSALWAISIIIIVISCAMIRHITAFNTFAIASILFGSSGTILFSLTSFSILPKLIGANKRVRYKNLNIFIIRQISSKIHSNYICVSVIFIVLLLTIGSLSYAYGMHYVLFESKYNAEESVAGSDFFSCEYTAEITENEGGNPFVLFPFNSPTEFRQKMMAIDTEGLFKTSDLNTKAKSIPRPQQAVSDVVDIKTAVHYISIYLSIVFMMTCSALLSIQQLTEAHEIKRNYELLSKLGADKRMLKKSLFAQIFFYFLAPILLAVIHSVVGFAVAEKFAAPGGEIINGPSPAIIVVFVFVVYCTNFILTYLGSRNLIPIT